MQQIKCSLGLDLTKFLLSSVLQAKFLACLESENIDLLSHIGIKDQSPDSFRLRDSETTFTYKDTFYLFG